MKREASKSGQKISKAEAKEIRELFRAARKGDGQFVRKMLKRGVDPNVQDESQMSLLTLAASKGYAPMVKMLLAAGADPNLAPEDGGGPFNTPPLESACAAGHLEIAKMLIEHGADVNQKGYWTPIKTAASHWQPRIVELLLNSGAKPFPTDLRQAVFRGCEEVAKQLVEAGVDVNQTSENKVTALHLAARRGNPRLVEMLIHAGAKVNVRTDKTWENDETPLHMAAFAGDLESVKLLLEAGADLSLKNRQGRTAEMLAKRRGRTQVTKFLREWNSERQRSKAKPKKVGKN